MDDEELRTIIGGEFEDYFQRARVYVEFLERIEEDQRVTALARVLTDTDNPVVERSGRQFNVQGLPQRTIDTLKNSLGQLVDGHLRYALAQRRSVEELAESLLPIVFGQPKGDDRVFALGWILVDLAIPYRQIPRGGVQMSDQQYSTRREHLRDKIGLLESISRYPGLQATEQASLALGVILDEEEPENQAVLLASLLQEASRRAAMPLFAELFKRHS